MFHNSGYRHEQYIVRSKHKKRTSLESEVSGADSGYTSSSSTSPTTTNKQHVRTKESVVTPTQKKTIIIGQTDSVNTNPFKNGLAHIEHKRTLSPTNPYRNALSHNKNEYRRPLKENFPIYSDISDYHNSSNKSLKSISTVTSTDTLRKKKSRREQPPRQPDLVYSCPRPLAFPFHNDDHFLPIAEADPRDVARISPLTRSSSLQSSKTSIGSSRLYDNRHFTSSSRDLGSESTHSRPASLISSIQRGTVRSIRSLFQLPDTLSNPLSRVNTNNSTDTQHLKPVIKVGTVQSIKDMLLRRSNTSDTVPPKPVITTTTNQPTQPSPSTPLPIPVEHVTPPQSKPFKSRAAEFASRAMWKSSKTPSPVKSNDTMTAENTLKNSKSYSLKSDIKKLSAKVMNVLYDKPSAKKTVKKTVVPATATLPTPPKKSKFSTFRQKTPDPVMKKKPSIVTSNTDTDLLIETPSTVKKMWKSFRNLVSGKKSSRIGVL